MRKAMIAVAFMIALGAIADQKVSSNSGAPVVIELFTSQGCSSCPPADDLLRRIAVDRALRGRVIPIAWHVDYWDYLGWRDPFSSHAWTERQSRYVHAFNLGGAYTPQAVVDGGRELVGSNERALRAAINEAAAARHDANVQLAISGNAVAITTTVPNNGLDLLLVTTEDDVTTEVQRGENSGMTMTDRSIARRAERLASPQAGTSTRRVPLEVNNGWNRARLHVIALLQDPKTLRIHAAASLAVPVVATTPQAASRP